MLDRWLLLLCDIPVVSRLSYMGSAERAALDDVNTHVDVEPHVDGVSMHVTF